MAKWEAMSFKNFLASNSLQHHLSSGKQIHVMTNVYTTSCLQKKQLSIMIQSTCSMFHLRLYSASCSILLFTTILFCCGSVFNFYFNFLCFITIWRYTEKSFSICHLLLTYLSQDLSILFSNTQILSYFLYQCGMPLYVRTTYVWSYNSSYRLFSISCSKKYSFPTLSTSRPLAWMGYVPCYTFWDPGW